jgi:hypothetical protein
MPADRSYNGVMVPDNNEHEMLARIDERLKHIERLIDEFVTRIEFAPIKALVFGLAFLMLSAVVTALVASVVK